MANVICIVKAEVMVVVMPMTTAKLPLTLLLMALIIFGGLVSPASANGITISVEAKGSSKITPAVSSKFWVEVWIRNLPQGQQITQLDLTLTFDPGQLEEVLFVSAFDMTWLFTGQVDNVAGTLVIHGSGSTPIQDDRQWLWIYFHCLKPGVSTINIVSAQWKNGEVTNSFSTLIPATVTQMGPVGGVVIPTSKLEILTPYLALVGLVAAVSAVVVVKKRRD